ncbi:MAG: DUF952 domain-containing protein [Anaerolineae bacterium]
MAERRLYHLAPAAMYRQQAADGAYRPPSLAEEGFIHCTAGRELLLKIANAFFQDLDDELLALEIDEGAVEAPVRYEPPAPVPHQEGVPPFAAGQLFPHIYGPLNRAAIVAIHSLTRAKTGAWTFAGQ